ncbi:MAG: SPFH domain-containing protein [Propionibacteriaceae bacterium]|jgi:regulator of protease activity HflC (stomatin/prohibitin superfamily)|nr:SPFH domain-containing protein [Propionibacteriaceae bacterium]
MSTTAPASPSDAKAMRAESRVTISEHEAWSMSGWPALFGMLIFTVVGVVLYVVAGVQGAQGALLAVLIIAGSLLIVIATILLAAIVIVSPGDTRVVQFFGRYTGTIRTNGIRMIVPFSNAKKVSIKVRNMETQELKVNDADGNPITIGAVIVWQVADTAKAVFSVEEYDKFVTMQSESALRHIASSHPYDNADPGEETLRGSTEMVADELAEEVDRRIQVAGLEVLETRITSLAYAPEIAHAMLQRQQAEAIIVAREKIVEGAVSMARAALSDLESDSTIVLDDERRAAMVSNLLVVLCGSSQASPVINTGTLYS